MKVKKRQAYAIAGLLILISGIFVVYAAVTATGGEHTSDEIIVEITTDCFVTLEDAISVSNGWLKGEGTPLCILVYPDSYHFASEIIVDINGHELTMQTAIDADYFKGTVEIYDSSSVPSKAHPATEIEIDGYDNLQDALNSEELRAVPCAPDCVGKDCGANDGCDDPCQTGNCPVGEQCTSGICTMIGNCRDIGETRTFSCANLDDECGKYSDGTQTCIEYHWVETTPCILNYADIGTTPCTPDVWGAASTSMRACDGIGNCIGENGAGCTDPGGPYDLTFYRDGDDYKYDLAGGYVADWSTALYAGWSGVYTRDDPVCQYRTCERWFIVCLEYSYSPRYWRIKPALCISATCPIPSQVPCGTTDTRMDNCGVPCNVLGTSPSNCNSGEVCYGGSCCDSYCPSSSSVDCGTTDTRYDGCGGYCHVVGTGGCPSDGSECDGDGFKHYWWYTCASGTCVYSHDWAIDSSCDY